MDKLGSVNANFPFLSLSNKNFIHRDKLRRLLIKARTEVRKGGLLYIIRKRSYNMSQGALAPIATLRGLKNRILP